MNRWLCTLVLAFALPCVAQSHLTITVTDENEAPVPSALVYLRATPQSEPLRCETDFSGKCEFPKVTAGAWLLHVERTNFYTVDFPIASVTATPNVDVRLTHLKEIRETVNVQESPPTIDPAQTASEQQLTGVDIINLPYPTSRDYRNVLNFIPGVIQDAVGQPHVAGTETYQTLTLLDGINVTQPANGMLLLRVSPDSLRSINVQTSRYSAQYGKGAGGVLALETGIGDDRFRFAGTNFIPSVQNKNGLHFDKVDPRFVFSGPIVPGRVWFYDSPEGEYDNIIILGLPSDANNDTLWRFGNLGKIQANLTSRNTLTGSFVVNRLHDEYDGLSPLSPQPTTPLDLETGYVGSAKDQHYFSDGLLLENGFAIVQYGQKLSPHGTLPYSIQDGVASGNYYFASNTRARRWQAYSNVNLPQHQWHGRHEFQFGIDLNRLSYVAAYNRTPVSFLRTGQSLPTTGNCATVIPSPCTRYSTFFGGDESLTNNAELSGYLQDRWSITDRWLVEPGLRFDWDEIVRRPLYSPRLASTYVLDAEGNTKLSAGIGIVYDPTNLLLIARPNAGSRVDYFFDANGMPVMNQPVIATTFSVDHSHLEAPRYYNWSIALERKLPYAIYLKAEFMQRRGTHGFVYDTQNDQLGGNFVLQNTRQDHYDAFHIDLRHNFTKTYMVFGSYTRSRSISNQVLDFNVDNPILSPQAPGPYPWDAPNRFIGWGFLPFFRLPVIHKLDFPWSVEWRSGFPFSVANQQEQLVEPPNDRRFPTYFSLNLFLEKRVPAFHAYWAVRFGFENITDHNNPAFVNSIEGTPQFLTFSGSNGRAFTTRIRFLGRK
ncbi:MAG TPA: TonB-dependent receptor [Terriglobales bacterium]|nr:TonB-dependent receptor [Terriglobales bacterium]